MLKEYSPLLSGSTEKAMEKDIKYETELSKESVWDGSPLDQARVDEMLKKFTAQGIEGYSTPPLCSSDTYLTIHLACKNWPKK
jgi:hypothetical protein